MHDHFFLWWMCTTRQFFWAQLSVTVFSYAFDVCGKSVEIQNSDIWRKKSGEKFENGSSTSHIRCDFRRVAGKCDFPWNTTVFSDLHGEKEKYLHIIIQWKSLLRSDDAKGNWTNVQLAERWRRERVHCESTECKMKNPSECLLSRELLPLFDRPKIHEHFLTCLFSLIHGCIRYVLCRVCSCIV